MAIVMKRQQSPNLSVNERSLLVELVTEFWTIVKIKRNDAVTQHEKATGWKDLTAKFNAVSAVDCHRPVHNLKSAWDNLKKITKRGWKSSLQEEDDDPLLSRVRDLIRPTVEGHFNPFDSDAMPGAMPNVGEVQAKQLEDKDWSNYSPQMLSMPVLDVLQSEEYVEITVDHSDTAEHQNILVSDGSLVSGDKARTNSVPSSCEILGLAGSSRKINK